MVLEVLWGVMQHSLKNFPSITKPRRAFHFEERLTPNLLIKTIPISFLSFYRIPRLETLQIQKVALRDTFHRSCEFYVQISMSLILTRSFYQEQLRNVGSLVLSIIDVHNERIHFILYIFADVKRDLFYLVVKGTIRKMK